MKKIYYLLLLLILIPCLGYSQDTVRTLIITEYRGDNMNNAYTEVTNVGEDTIDLSKFFFECISPWGGHVAVVTYDGNGDIVNIMYPYNGVLLRHRWGKVMSGELLPGQSYVISNVWDAFTGPLAEGGQIRQNIKLLEKTDLAIHAEESYDFWYKETYFPEYEVYDFDSIDGSLNGYWEDFDWLQRYNTGRFGFCIMQYLDNGDSVMVDQVRLAINPATGMLFDIPSDVAGVEGGSATHVLVRKAKIKRGNLDWEESRGVDLQDSEWIPIPMFNGRGIPFETIGNHGDFSLAIASDVVDINLTDTLLDVPWGIRKGDSLVQEFTLGKGHAWQYIEDTLSMEDSAYTIVREGDIFNVYVCGNELNLYHFSITVKEPAADMAMVFPMRKKEIPDPEVDPWGSWTTPYYVTDEDPEIDTIGNIPFASRVDTLMKYLLKAPKASWEIIWVDGLERVDLKRGDILEVTAENGTTKKQYFIDVLEYEKNTIALLGAITWPEMPYPLELWNNDTIPGFSPNKFDYQILLPPGTRDVPAFIALPQDLNAKIKTKPAVFLGGGAEDRTTVFTVTAEDDTSIVNYSVLFTVEKTPENTQTFRAEPLFTEFVCNQIYWNGFIEIGNPGNVPLDLSQYMIVTNKTSANPAAAISALTIANPTPTSFLNRYQFSYVPGYKYYGDTATWLLNPGILLSDVMVNPIIEAGDVFVIHKSHGITASLLSPNEEKADVILSGVDNHNTWGEPINYQNSIANLPRGVKAVFLFKILNDSILEGTKAVGDPFDFELIDLFADPTPGDVNWTLAGEDFHMNTGRGAIRLKPHRFLPTTEIGFGWGTTADSSDWELYRWNSTYNGVYYEWPDIGNNLGLHSFKNITEYLSTVASLVYRVSEGYGDGQMIRGDMSSTSVESFLGNIIKSDENQTLTLISGSSGLVLAPTDPVNTNDTLKVIAADNSSTTIYALVNNPLDNDAVLTTVNSPSGITISIEGSTGTIQGFSYGSLLRDAIDSLKVPDFATIRILDPAGQIVPLRVLKFDSTYSDTKVGNLFSIEVRAENGATIISYKLEAASLSSDAFVVSTIFDVNTETGIIASLPDDLAVTTFWNVIEVVKGAQATLLDKAGYERVSGQMSYDDKLKVVSEDGTASIVYYLDFLMETDPDYNMAPTVSVAFADSTIMDVLKINVSATADDDGMPYGSTLSYLWEVVEGESGNVTFIDASALATEVTFTKTGTYKLQITANDSELSAMYEVVVTVKSSVGISGQDAPAIRMYPNPASELISIELEEPLAERTQLRVFSITGGLTAEYQLDKGISRQQLDISGYSSGLYYLELSRNGLILAVQKLIVQ